jgi:hypothetical protein
MAMNKKMQLAEILRSAARLTIAETDFWDQLKTLMDSHDPIDALAYESSVHYWGNFHERNILLIRTKPDKGALSQGRDELNLLADAYEGDWPADEVKRRLRDI